jgi:hypothetical protein
MTIGFSPFLMVDVDETFGFPPQSSPARDTSMSDSLRLELIRRRVLTGYYSSPTVVSELARRLIERGVLEES